MSLPFATSGIAKKPMGAYRVSYPIPQDTAHQFVVVDYTSALTNYATTALDTTFATDTGGVYGTTPFDAYFCVENGPMQWVDGKIVKWSVTYANVPTSPRLETQGVIYTYPGFDDGSGNIVRNPLPYIISSIQQYLYIQSTTPTADFQITSGPLTIGQWYQFYLYASGDDFSNVGAQNGLGTSVQFSGFSFMCTGTTPTTWNNGSILTPLVNQFSPFLNGNQSNIQNILTPNNYLSQPYSVPAIGNSSNPSNYTYWILNPVADSIKNKIPIEGSILERYIGNIWVARTRYAQAF